MPSIRIIIPAYNEAQSIGRIVSDVRQLYPDARLVVVNDCSTDDTAALARAAGANVIDLPVNMGYGVALHTGLIWAARQHADIVITLDADGQHAPADIEKLLAPVLSGQADLTVGSRYLPQSVTYRVPVLRRWGARFFAAVVSALTRQRFTDPTSGFQCLNAGVLHLYVELLDFPEKTPDADILLYAHLHGFRIQEVAVNMRADEGRDSMHGVLKSLFYIPNMLTAILGILLAQRTGRRKGS